MGKAKKEKELTVTDLLEWVKTEVCDDYCKYPEVCMSKKKDPDDAERMLYEEYCLKCPLTRL